MHGDGERREERSGGEERIAWGGRVSLRGMGGHVLLTEGGGK